MSMMSKSGKPKKSELPATLRRSEAKAQRTFAKAHDSALDEYGDEERAYRVGYQALKRTYEKVGDSWRAKEQAGPSDARSEEGRDSNESTAGGVDANASKAHLYDLAKELGIEGRSRMTKPELVEALQRENESRTKAANRK